MTKSNASDIELKPVTSEAEIPALADINSRALEGDPIKQWMALFAGRSEYQSTVDAVTSALTDPVYSIVKAVIDDPDSSDGEKIVGFCHWLCGWIVLEKVDPFVEKAKYEQQLKQRVTDARDVTSNIAENLAQEADALERKPKQSAEEAEQAARLRAGEAKFVETRNHYISAIRGKKHMYIRRLMVLPEYQGQGIAGKLLKNVTDEADRQKIVCWLFSRPAGEKLYERAGFKAVAETEMDEKDFDFKCDQTKSMMRLPKPFNGAETD